MWDKLMQVTGPENNTGDGIMSYIYIIFLSFSFHVGDAKSGANPNKNRSHKIMIRV